MSIGGYKLRKNSRFRVELPARARKLNEFTWKRGSVLNLSKTGLCFLSREPLEREDEIEIEVESVDRDGKIQQRRMAGRIMWKKGMKYGVLFTGGDRRRQTLTQRKP